MSIDAVGTASEHVRNQDVGMDVVGRGCRLALRTLWERDVTKDGFQHKDSCGI